MENNENHLKRTYLKSFRSLDTLSEFHLKLYLLKIRLKWRPIDRELNRTPDICIEENYGLDATNFHFYTPYCMRDFMDRRKNEMGTDRQLIIFGDSKWKPKINILDEKKIDCEYSINRFFFLEKSFRKKIKNIIEDKDDQILAKFPAGGVIHINFPTFPLDPRSIYSEIKFILNEFGYCYPKMFGVLAGTWPSPLGRPFFQPLYVFIKNPYTPLPEDLMKFKEPNLKILFHQNMIRSIPLAFVITYNVEKPGWKTFQFKPPHTPPFFTRKIV